MVFRRARRSVLPEAASISAPIARDPGLIVPARDAGPTRRAARDDLLAGIGIATEANLSLGKILRDAFVLVDDMASFSTEFETTAALTRTRAEQFVASVDQLQNHSEVIEARLSGTATTLAQAYLQSQSALSSVDDLTRSINEIERVIHMIATIAHQTNLLALNATIEAARAGSAGAGFGVVASEVKALSQATQRATNEIVASVNSIRDRAQINKTNVTSFDQTVRSIEELFSEMHLSVQLQSEQTRDIGAGSNELVQLAHTVRLNAGRMRTLGASVKSMTDLAEDAAAQARRAFGSLADRAAIVLAHSDADGEEAERPWPVMLPAVLTLGNRIEKVRVIDLSRTAIQIETGSDVPTDRLGDIVKIDVEGIGAFDIRLLAATTSGYYTSLVLPSRSILDRIDAKVATLRQRYEPYIVRVREVAEKVGGEMDEALRNGLIVAADLFDVAYQRDGATEPAQYTNAAVAPLEGFLRPLVEHELKRAPMPDFCFLQDRNGFAALHNLRFSLPPRAGDIIYNLRNSRTRRIFDDRAGMSASRNLRPFLVQSYARDMGDRIDLRMEFDAPIFAKGRHWGTVRMAYELTDATVVPAQSKPRLAALA